MSEVQKQQALTESNLQFEQGKSQFIIQRLQVEADIKKQLMAEEFNYSLQLAKIKANSEGTKEKEIEDRKDFESAGNDTLGGFSLDSF